MGDVNAPNNHKETLLHTAVQLSNAEMVKLLLDAGANVNPVNVAAKGSKTPLHIAAAQPSNAAVVKLLLDAGASPDLLL